MIKELNDLVHFTKTSIWRDEELLLFFSKHDDALLQLYRSLWQHELPSDEAAARALGVSLSTYKKWGRRLRGYLREMAVFFNDEKAKVDATTKNYLEGTLETAILDLLMARGYRHAPEAIAKRLLRRSTEYDMPAFAVSALRLLKESVSGAGGHPGQFEEYSRLYWQYRDYADIEERAADSLRWLQLPHWRAAPPRQPLSEQIRQRLSRLEPWTGRTPSGSFHQDYYLLKGHFLLEILDYEGALFCYDEALAWFEAKTYPVSTQLALFHSAKIMVNIFLKQYPAGEAAALAALDHATDGSRQFFETYELYFYLSMHTAHYEEALEIFKTVTLHKRFGSLPESQREAWKVLGAYLFLVFRLQGRDGLPRELPAPKSGRFTNETLSFVPDKRGMNIAVLIAHALLQLLESKWDAFLERSQSLERYRQRHLRAAGAERSGLFIRLLASLPKVQYKAQPFLQKAAPRLRQLDILPRQLTRRTQELEVVPYNTLAHLLAGYLQRRPF
ncbi:MAG: hypothetical protein IT260_00970 [Saprospiraceae bacterium]|nr:hypothetical protein [Saprospiraceae bacterium]